MIRRFPFLEKMPIWLRLSIQRHFWPITVSNITGLVSTKGDEVHGYLISIPMTAAEMLKDKARARRHIRRATRLARNKGAKIAGLGALTSSLSRGGLDLVDIPGISITTGHAYTGHTVTKTLLARLKEVRVPYESSLCTIAIVGAAGSVGSISAEILASKSVKNLLLVDLERKMDAVHSLREKLTSRHPELTVECSQDMTTLKRAVGVITATNAPDALIRSEYITPGTILVDDAQPSDISPELYDRDDIVVLEAGAVYTPGISSNFNMGLADKYDNFCCLAEVLILASRKHTHNFVVNRATLKDVEHIKEGGEALGFTLARPQNELGLVSQDKIAHVGELARARVS
jgi:predicted amino acid dehydrogenase